MAERRMFAKTIMLSDEFLDMSMGARCLYQTIGMLADDDGFVNNVKSIMRQVGASIDDLNLLIAKKFLIDFGNGIVAVKHWKVHNYIQKDRYKETKYLKEKSLLLIDERSIYSLDVSKMDTQVRLGKVSLVLGKGSGSGSEDDNGGTDSEDNTFELFGGTLGKNVVLLTPAQQDSLLEQLGLDAFNFYMDKLSTFIIQKNAKVGNHYATILKWAKEDAKL